ncbi:MAG: gamma-glutamylcyclotransferase, partial [Hyphomicrobiaceae bacterium]
HRGRPERPGLVLGLDRGGMCDGIAYRVAPENARATAEYLRVREQVNGVYREALLPVTIEDGRRREVMAQAYIVERAHPSFTGPLTLAEQAHIIRGAKGLSGANLDYLINTLAHLDQLGIHEPELQRLLTLIGPLFSRGGSAGLASPRVAALLNICRRIPCKVATSRPGERRRFIHRRQIAVWRSG